MLRAGESVLGGVIEIWETEGQPELFVVFCNLTYGPVTCSAHRLSSAVWLVMYKRLRVASDAKITSIRFDDPGCLLQGAWRCGCMAKTRRPTPRSDNQHFALSPSSLAHCHPHLLTQHRPPTAVPQTPLQILHLPQHPKPNTHRTFQLTQHKPDQPSLWKSLRAADWT